LSGGDVSVVECFVGEQGYANEADSCHDGEDPETPVPLCDVENEGREKGAEVWGEDDESGPDVDFAARAELAIFLLAMEKGLYGCSWKKKISLMNMSPP
jgi:hypothetical protein